jgi:hypothetical protein
VVLILVAVFAALQIIAFWTGVGITRRVYGYADIADLGPMDIALLVLLTVVVSIISGVNKPRHTRRGLGVPQGGQVGEALHAAGAYGRWWGRHRTTKHPKRLSAVLQSLGRYVTRLISDIFNRLTVQRLGSDSTDSMLQTFGILDDHFAATALYSSGPLNSVHVLTPRKYICPLLEARSVKSLTSTVFRGSLNF